MAAGTSPVLKVGDLSTHFFTREGVVRAVDRVSFELEPGKTLGLVGESGCGKSVTALSLMRLVRPPGRIVSGQVLLDGKDLLQLEMRKLLHVQGKRVSMIFQDPSDSLNPTITIGEQVMEALDHKYYDAWRAGWGRGALAWARRELGRDLTDRKRLRSEAVHLLAQMGIPDPERRLSEYPYMLSGGLLQRCMIAIALASRPAVLIADEPTTALDVTIQAQILDLLKQRQEDLGVSILLITHDLGVVAEVCDRVAVMYAGRIVEQGTVDQIFRHPRHPYTRALLRSVPDMEGRRPKLSAIEGAVPSLIGLQSDSCYFADRCPDVMHRCRTSAPAAVADDDGRIVACHLYVAGTPGRSQREARRDGARHDREPASIGMLPSGLTEPAVAERCEDATLLEVKDLVKYYPTRSHRLVRAVDGVSFAIKSGETLSLVGESGCGKTTTGQVILGLQPATNGQVFYGGTPINTRDRSLRRRMQVVFQNPYSSLDPRMRIREILREPLRIHGVPRREQEQRIKDLLSMVRLQANFGDRYPFELSGGQRQRVAIARALALRPEFIVLDEPVSALDVSVQAQIVNLLQDLQSEFGLAYLFISHDLRVVRHMSDRIAVMYLGKIVEIGPAESVIASPAHPYTKALISAVPRADPVTRAQRIVLKGEIPSSTDVIPGCRFAGRCRYVMEICRRIEPLLTLSPDGRATACHLVNPTEADSTPAAAVVVPEAAKSDVR